MNSGHQAERQGHCKSLMREEIRGKVCLRMITARLPVNSRWHGSREVEEELSTDFCWLLENMVTVPQLAVVEQGKHSSYCQGSCKLRVFVFSFFVLMKLEVDMSCGGGGGDVKNLGTEQVILLDKASSVFNMS